MADIRVGDVFERIGVYRQLMRRVVGIHQDYVVYNNGSTTNRGCSLRAFVR